MSDLGDGVFPDGDGNSEDGDGVSMTTSDDGVFPDGDDSDDGVDGVDKPDEYFQTVMVILAKGSRTIHKLYLLS